MQSLHEKLNKASLETLKDISCALMKKQYLHLPVEPVLSELETRMTEKEFINFCKELSC